MWLVNYWINCIHIRWISSYSIILALCNVFMFYLTTLISSEYTVSDGSRILKRGVKRPWPNLMYSRAICLKGQKRTTVNLRTGRFHSMPEAISSGPGLTNVWHAAFCAVPNFFYFFIRTSVSTLCLYTRIWLRVNHFYTNRKRRELVTGHLSWWCCHDGEWASAWLEKTF